HLMRRVARWARGKRLDAVHGDVLEDNGPLLDLARSMGFERVDGADPGLGRVRLPLAATTPVAGVDGAAGETARPRTGCTMLPAPPLLRALMTDKTPPGSPAPLPLPVPPLPGPGRPRAWWRAPASRSALAWFVAAAARAHDGVLLAVARDNHAATQIEA